MIKASILGQEYVLPSIEDVTFSRMVEFVSAVGPLAPEAGEGFVGRVKKRAERRYFKRKGKRIGSDAMALNFARATVGFWLNMDRSLWTRIPEEEVLPAFEYLSSSMEGPGPGDFPEPFVFRGELVEARLVLSSLDGVESVDQWQVLSKVFAIVDFSSGEKAYRYMPAEYWHEVPAWEAMVAIKAFSEHLNARTLGMTLEGVRNGNN